MGRGGGQVVSVLAFSSDDPSSNPAEANNFFRKIVFEKNENKQKRGRGRYWRTFSLFESYIKGCWKYAIYVEQLLR